MGCLDVRFARMGGRLRVSFSAVCAPGRLDGWAVLEGGGRLLLESGGLLAPESGVESQTNNNQ